MAKKTNKHITIIGNGSNVLVKDKGIRGIVVNIDFENINIKEKDKNALFISRNGNRISHQAVQLLIKKLFTQMGIASQGYSVHKLRHTAATLMYQYGNIDIRTLKEILGHENLNTTEIYTHVSDNELKKAIDANPLSHVKRKATNKVDDKNNSQNK